MPYLSVGDVARRLGVKPAIITNAFYRNDLNNDLCPVVGGRRLIPSHYIPTIAIQLRRKGINVRESDLGEEGIQ